MNKFLMVCYACADFVGKNGDVFSVTPKQLGIFIEAPEWIKGTNIFKWMVSDGTIKMALKDGEKKKLENDPMEGISAEGKAKEITEAAEKAMTEEAAEEATEEATEDVGDGEEAASPEEEAPKAEKEEKTTKGKTTKAKKGESK